MFSIKVAALTVALAESHTVTFDNRAARPSPPGSLTPATVLSLAPLPSSRPCDFNGEGYTLVETTLVNPGAPGSGSSTDLSLIPSHSFSVTTGFGYTGGCAPAGADCNNANCNTAFHNSNDNFVQVACQQNDASLVFCFEVHFVLVVLRIGHRHLNVEAIELLGF
ncbi:glycopeptide [Mycena galopus ATCC 62051]|nr:glycopeptide [Mycena galopus ATCC 62051]